MQLIDAIFDDQFRPALIDHYKQNKIVRRADYLLKALQSVDQLPLEEQQQFYDHLEKQLLQCTSLQALALIHNQNEQIVDQLLELCLTNENHTQQLFRIINWFLKAITLTKRNYKSMFMYIKNQMYNSQLTNEKVQRFISILQKVFAEYSYDSPYASFYFNYINSGLVVDTREMKWLFSKGISIQTWLYPIAIKSEVETKIMYLMSDKKKGCQFILNGNKLVYQYVDLNSPHHEAPISLIEIPYHEWSSLCIQIQLRKFFLQESYYLYLTCGGQQLREIKIDFPQISNDSLVIEFQFFTNFYGYVTCMLIYNDGFDGNDLTCGDKDLGIQSNDHLRNLHKCHGNNKLVLCYTPLRARANFITDPINKFDGALQSYSGSYLRITQKQQFSQFCRIENFVPLLLFIRIQPYDSLLNELLTLFCQIIKSKPETQQDAIRTEYLSLIALKLNDSGLDMINNQTIELLSQLNNSIQDTKLKQQFICNLLWRIQIYKLDNFSIIQDYLKFIRMIYNGNPEFCISIFGISKILEILIYDIDPKNRLCCEEHANQMGYTNFQLPTISYAQLIDSYLNIIDAILQNKLFQSQSKIEKSNIIDIARVFTLKCSPCFYQLLLKKLQGLFQYENKNNNPISQILIQEEVMQMLLNLLTTCSCPDVKTSCIKLIAESIRINQSSNEKEIANWIAHTLGNSAAVEVLETYSDDEDEDYQPRKPLINQALVFHQQEEQQNSIEEKKKQPVIQKKKIVQPNRRIIDYEPLYVAIMEWMLKTRVGKTNSDTLILDENLIIKSDGGLSLLISYFQYCVDSVKGRIMQDLCMLIKWNQASAIFLLNNEEFHWWILETLLEIQHQYNNRELAQFEFWVWDSGLKLYCNVIKAGIQNEKNGFQRLAQLQSYCRVLEELNVEQTDQQSTQLLIRLIYKQLLSNLSDCYKLDLFSTFWVNLYSVIFETFRLVTADPRTMENEHYYLFHKFQPISFKLTISQQEMPKKWKQQFGIIQWVDHILIVNICDIVNQFCGKFSTQIISYLDDYQIVQKGILGILEQKNPTESQKSFAAMMFEFDIGLEQNQSPIFIQVCQLFLQLNAEYFAFNVQSSENIKQLQVILNALDKLIRTLIIASETLRDKEIEETQDKVVYSIIGSHFIFLYQMEDKIKEINYDKEIKQELLQIVRNCLFYSFKFLIVYVDCFTQILNKNESFQTLIFEGYKQYKLFLMKMLNDLIRKDSSHIFEVNETKSLKLNNKLIMEKMISAKQVFVENQTLLQKIKESFFMNEEYYLKTKCDFEESYRIFAQKKKSLQDKLQQQRQGIEEVLFSQMISSSSTYSYDQKIQRIDSEQIYMRQARYMFKKSFNRVRVFNQWWAHPEFKAQIDKPFNSIDMHYENITQNQIFTWKMWKYETKQKSRPLLKPKLYDYPQIDNIMQSQQQSTRIMNLADYDKKQPERQRKRIHEIIFDTIIPFYSQQHEQDEVILHRVQWIKTLTVRIGSLRISDTHLIFYFESITQKETHQSLIKFRVPEDSQLVKQWDLEQIYDIQFRRYIGRWTSLELTLLEGSTLVFNFQNGDHQKVIEKLISLKKHRTINIKPRILSGKLDPVSVMLESKAMNKWYNYKITTFEYLMKVNKISGRSNKDLTQYPVFPWIMNDGEQLHKYRDLTKSMGALGTKDRIEVFEQRYNMIDHFNKVPQFHYGSHYSSPAIIFHYLIRMKPFSDGAKELQSGKFDLADRLFFSFIETYRNAVEELSDVRELIPEFFYLPEMFLNLSKYDYGLQQTGQRVNNVELPFWTQQNPYLFICAHRMELESDYVSQHICNWIDLIFGYKQKGEEAVKALNTFYYLTYENSIDWDSIKNEKQKISLESQAIHFGQCPSQIWDRPHISRGKQKIIFRIVDEKIEKRIFRQKQNNPQTQSPNYQRNKSIIRIHFLSDNKVWIIRRNGECATIKLDLKDNKFDLNNQKEQSINFGKFLDENQYLFDWTCNYDELPVLNRGKQVLVGGIWDGRLLIYNNGIISEQRFEQEHTITVMRFDYKMRILATGSKDGTLIIYKVFNNQYIPITKHHHHDQSITDIFICNDLKVVLTCSSDSWIHMYNQWSGKYLRSYRHPKGLPINKVCSYCTPLYGIAFYENKNIYSYSINGQFLAHLELKQYVVNQGHLKVVKDSKLTDIIVLPLCLEKKILMLTTPFLQKRNEIQLTDCQQSMNDISSFALSPDRTILAFGTSDGEFGLAVDQKIFQQD
ncbi:unnamed protein product [Paramecium pentaurelia]|uniref:Beige/BEACH domain protein n=1 Tax=Paramecium pentaurelia TaxID=43138 RepID=A0A8S1XMZ6_9CILI|nr:unnamed protein product [Paramecium pentaurelia]